MTPFGCHSDRSVSDLVADAVLAALRDADVTVEEIGVVFTSISVQEPSAPPTAAGFQTVLSALGLGHVPVVNVESAGTSGAMAFWAAARSVETGAAPFALAVGAAKAAGQHSDPIEMDRHRQRLRQHMEAFGWTMEDVALVAAKNRKHASWNQYAQFRGHTAVEDILVSPAVVGPITRMMCSSVADGAAAVILGPSDRRSPVVAASVVRSGCSAGAADGTTQAAVDAYHEAAVGPLDIDVAEVHDITSSAELLAYEDLLFAAPGDAVDLVRSGATTIGGRLPVNTSGGLVARGYAGGATGLAMIHEVTLQLRGDAPGRRVDGCQVGLVHNAGGRVAEGQIAAAVHILRRP